ncbi:glutamate-1-semialdehyde aminotransferase [candidate division MSBL1 archaeon SCGC-AAA259O05]|uniref:Glutamate-1-semialdehyde 2,1-aminomutase n=1 Tax=candidate division MSBL1 archaeon SCGC-AAA259O05 TaxID=1698271 RepID=A0A133V5R4_9EURY|nr:glutamate-1-semialdehyde aminotransferase [candidate division MSBL1 archaeon SCGC-AAA259O05]
MNSKDLYEESKVLFPGGVNSPVRAFKPYPFFVESGNGSKIYDADGNEYLDYCLGYGPLILGHKHPAVLEAVRDQLEKGSHFGIPTEAESRLAEKIVDHVPAAEMVRFVNSGTEATVNAVRLARGYTGKENILMFDGGYHGANDSLLFDSGGSKTPGIPKALEDSTLVAPFNDLEKVRRIAGENELAAIVVEPVMGNVGCIPPVKGFLKGLREVCDDINALLVFDEVITGFRLAMGGAQEYFDVHPDLVTLGKIIGGGFPIGAFGGEKEIMEEVTPEGEVFHAGTFSGHPVAMSAGKATIEVLENENTIGRTSSFAEKLAGLLREESEYPVNQIGPMLQVFFREGDVRNAEDARLSDSDKFKRFHRSLMDSGVFIPPSRMECWFISAAHSSKDLDNTKNAIKDSLEEIGRRP